MNLIIDDLRDVQMCFNTSGNPMFKDLSWSIVKTFDEFVDFIDKNGLPNVISFDHDLADFKDGREFTGMDCATWLTNYCMDNEVKLPLFFVHSDNTVGNENIRTLLSNFRKHVG